jgi:hypothetical protein
MMTIYYKKSVENKNDTTEKEPLRIHSIPLLHQTLASLRTTRAACKYLWRTGEEEEGHVTRKTSQGHEEPNETLQERHTEKGSLLGKSPGL